MAAEDALVVKRHQTFFKVAHDEHSSAEVQQSLAR
jgi:hypothetical protein